MNTNSTFYDITTLTPLQGECEPFHKEVQKLQRPYLPIKKADYETLARDSRGEYYLTQDGQVVTFGNADQGFALMPLQTEYANNIKAANNIATKPEPLSEKEYATQYYGNCPACRSDQITGGGIDVEGNQCFQRVSCQDCEHTWEDVYTLTGYQSLECSA